MARMGWNMNSSSTNGFTIRPRHPATPIACRICNLVVSSTPALIDHVESCHSMQANNNRNRQLVFLSNLQRQGNPLANPLPESSRNPIAFTLTPRNINMVPPQQLQLGNRYSFGLPPLIMQPTMTPHRVVEETATDGTKPFLQQLDKPYSCNAALMNNPDADMLDLTLRL